MVSPRMSEESLSEALLLIMDGVAADAHPGDNLLIDGGDALLIDGGDALLID